MDETPEPEEPANLKFLRLLVTVLAGTMIVGLLVLISLIVIRFQDNSTEFPNEIALPDGQSAEAFTQTKRWYAVVTVEGEILVFSRSTGKLLQRIEIAPGEI